MIPFADWRVFPLPNPFHSGISCRPGLVVSVISLFYLSQHLVSIKTNEIDKHRSMLSVEGAADADISEPGAVIGTG